MKNALKMLGIIAIAAVIGFWAASCGDDDGGGGNATSGNTITSGAELVYDPSIGNTNEAKNATDFSFYFYWDDEKRTEEFKPLSNFLDGSPSVTISDNKVSINLGTPKAAYLEKMVDDKTSEGITITPSDVKGLQMSEFYTSDRKYCLVCMKDDDNFAMLVYVDKDVTIRGSTYLREWEAGDGNHGGEGEMKYNVSLKKGWNYVIFSINEETETGTVTSSTTQPSGFKWTVIDNNDHH